jgi:two-component system, NtrC family, response regulator GlrR
MECPRPMSKRPHVLIIDDDTHVLGLFVRTLTREHYTVTSTASGKDAMDLALRIYPDLVILDLNMPDPDGFEILKILRARRPDLRVVVVSGSIQGVILNAATLFGAVATLEKPVPPELLLGTVERVLGLDMRQHRFAGKTTE